MVHAESTDWPVWVLDPQAEGSVAAGECVPWSGSISIDRQQITANARLILAQQIGIKIQGMDKTYSARVDAGLVPKLSSSFESTSQQAVEAMLVGSRLRKIEEINHKTGRFLCGLVSLDQDADKRIVQAVARSAGAQSDAETEEILLAKFRSKSAGAGAK